MNARDSHGGEMVENFKSHHLLSQRYEGVVVHIREELQLEEDGARGQGQDDHLYVIQLQG